MVASLRAIVLVDSSGAAFMDVMRVRCSRTAVVTIDVVDLCKRDKNMTL